MASSRSLPAGLVSRVGIILMSASGKTNQQIARQLGLARPWWTSGGGDFWSLM